MKIIAFNGCKYITKKRRKQCKIKIFWKSKKNLKVARIIVTVQVLDSKIEKLNE